MHGATDLDHISTALKAPERRRGTGTLLVEAQCFNFFYRRRSVAVRSTDVVLYAREHANARETFQEIHLSPEG